MTEDAQCSLDWSYQTHLCEEELLSYPDASFHLLLLMKGALFFRCRQRFF